MSQRKCGKGNRTPHTDIVDPLQRIERVVCGRAREGKVGRVCGFCSSQLAERPAIRASRVSVAKLFCSLDCVYEFSQQATANMGSK